jgi:acetaldehyde dehydrogenase (acetylating)
MIKVLRNAEHLEIAAMVGIDPASDGLARAQRMGVATTHEGVEGLTRMDVFKDIDFVFDATSAGAHVKNDAFLRSIKPDIRLIDLTPAAIGPYCVLLRGCRSGCRGVPAFPIYSPRGAIAARFHAPSHWPSTPGFSPETA